MLKEVLSNMKNISIPGSQFEALRDKMIRDWNNVALGNATGIAREGMRKMLRKYYYDSSEMAGEAGNLND